LNSEIIALIDVAVLFVPGSPFSQAYHPLIHSVGVNVSHQTADDYGSQGGVIQLDFLRAFNTALRIHGGG